jgi:hypothetical protein
VPNRAEDRRAPSGAAPVIGLTTCRPVIGLTADRQVMAGAVPVISSTSMTSLPSAV